MTSSVLIPYNKTTSDGTYRLLAKFFTIERCGRYICMKKITILEDGLKMKMNQNMMKLRLNSIESQPKKVVVVVGIVVVVLVGIIVGHQILTLKSGQNQVNNK